MLAFLVAVAALVYWGVVGRGLLAVFWTRRRPIQTFLLAPAVGLAATVICLFTCSRANIPLRDAAWPITGSLLVLACAAIWWRRPLLPLGRLAPFAGVVLGIMLLIGWPMLKFGFDWVSYCNDDMGNYLLFAQCLYDHGWYDPIDVSALIEGREGSRKFVFLYDLAGYRPGAEMMLAWLARVSGQTTLTASMPLLLSMHGAMVMAAGGLVCRGRSSRVAALTACLVVGVSGPLALGTLNQLLGQTGGLALLCASAALWFRTVRARSWRCLPLRIFLLGIMLAGSMIEYCEVAPFLGLGFVVHAGLSWYRGRLRFWQTAAVGVGGLAVCLAVMREYFPLNFGFVLGQALRSGSGNAHAELFPYYTHPTGLASLFSFQCFHIPLPEPWLSVGIVSSLVLLLLAAAAALWLSWRRAAPVAVLAGIILTLAAFLLTKGASFGLFKLAMYCQPFLLGVLALGWARLGRWRWLAAPLLLLYVLGAGRTTFSFAEQSFGTHGILEVKWATEDGAFRRLREDLRRSPSDHVVFTGDNSFSLKVASTYNGTARSMRTPVYPFVQFSRSTPNYFLSDSERDRMVAMLDAIEKPFIEVAFDLHDPEDPERRNYFFCQDIATAGKPERPAVICPSGRLSLLNRRQMPEAGGGGFAVRPLDEVRNWLSLVDSSRGHQYFLAGGTPKVALYQLEGDYFYRGKTMASLGRDLLFEVINPDPSARIMIDLTTTLAANGDYRLPEGYAIGCERSKLPFTGRGAARVISEPLAAQPVAGYHYVGLDLGERFFQFDPAPGLWNNMGRGAIVDRRKLIAFGRDISLLSEEEYANLTPPTMLSDPKQDIRHRDLEFSGIYEDAWMSEHAWFRPSSGGASADLVVEVFVPNIGDLDFRTTLRVVVDGREVARRTVGPGPVALREPVEGLSPRPKVELIFEDGQRLPNGDRRITGALLQRLGFEARQAAKGQ